MMNSEERCRVLLVEDSRGDAMVTQALLAEAGRRTGTRFHVDHVSSYAETLEQLSIVGYDVMLLDLGLPDSEGVAPVAELCERYPSLAIVVMTALEDTDAAIDAVASGAQEFLPKGKVRPDELARVLRHAILRRRMDQTVRESEAEHRALFELNPHPIWVFDRQDLRFLAANDAAVRQYGWTLDQFLSMRVTDIRPPEDIPLLLDFLHGDLGAGADRIWRHRTRDGRELQVQLSAHHLEFYGRPAVLVLTRNVNENAQLAQAVDVGERRFRDLFDASPTPLFEHDLDGCLLSSNAAGAAVLGHLPQALIGLGLQQFVPSHFVATVERYLEQLRASGSFDGILVFGARGARRRQFRFRSRRYDAPGRPALVIAMAQEIIDAAPGSGASASGSATDQPA
jgi:PAS domain S-box-containing protein